MLPMNKRDRELDVVVWGATGFTGQLVAEVLANKIKAGATFRWAIGGRNRDKLEGVRATLARIDPRFSELPLVVADASDRDALAAIAARTRVVASFVGPYAIHGRALVAACAREGTDYVDLTGEVPFMRAIVDAHHEEAKASGARIVPACGFDSIPSDLGNLVLQQHALERYGAPCHDVKLVVTKLRGGFSGGTVASMANLVEAARRDPIVRAHALDPYALSGGERGPDGRDQSGARYDEELGAWTGPFVMAATNTRVVRRSSVLLGHPWSREFRYSECMRTGEGVGGWLRAVGTGAAMTGAVVAFGVPPLAAVVRSLLPAQGEGPSEEQRARGSFEIQLFGTPAVAGAPRLRATVSGLGDPGYASTSRMIAESALCLAAGEGVEQGGVLTTASCMGTQLVERLVDADVRFEVKAAP
jgi:short subunit dehydrogenase-like uncharacterized protein